MTREENLVLDERLNNVVSISSHSDAEKEILVLELIAIVCSSAGIIPELSERYQESLEKEIAWIISSDIEIGQLGASELVLALRLNNYSSLNFPESIEIQKTACKLSSAFFSQIFVNYVKFRKYLDKRLINEIIEKP